MSFQLTFSLTASSLSRICCFLCEKVGLASASLICCFHSNWDVMISTRSRKTRTIGLEVIVISDHITYQQQHHPNSFNHQIQPSNLYQKCLSKHQIRFLGTQKDRFSPKPCRTRSLLNRTIQNPKWTLLDPKSDSKPQISTKIKSADPQRANNALFRVSN